MKSEDFVREYLDDQLTFGEFLFLLAKHTRAENIDSIISQLPTELLDKVERFTSEATIEGGGFFASNYSEKDILESQEALTRAVPIIRQWFAEHTHSKKTSADWSGRLAATQGKH